MTESYTTNEITFAYLNGLFLDFVGVNECVSGFNTPSHVVPAFIALTAELHSGCPGRKSPHFVNTVSYLEEPFLGTATHKCV